MKIIALMTVKNESWILPTTLSALKDITDEIIVIDDGSTDNSVEILRQFRAVVVSNNERPESGWAEFSIREKLLRLGREHGGTHFICLDADEIFSTQFRQKARALIATLAPKEKISLPWITLWKNIATKRVDGVYANLIKSFIFCDHTSLSYNYAFLGVSRTPNATEEADWRRAADDVVLHFQHVDFKRAQLKQAWYRCSELIKGERSAQRINATYSITLDKNVKTEPVPKTYFGDIELPKEENFKSDWHLKEMWGWFDKYGIEFFEPLQIWHVKELREEFIKRVRREPKSKTFPTFLIKLNDIKNKLKNR